MCQPSALSSASRARFRAAALRPWLDFLPLPAARPRPPLLCSSGLLPLSPGVVTACSGEVTARSTLLPARDGMPAPAAPTVSAAVAAMTPAAAAVAVASVVTASVAAAADAAGSATAVTPAVSVCTVCSFGSTASGCARLLSAARRTGVAASVALAASSFSACRPPVISNLLSTSPLSLSRLSCSSSLSSSPPTLTAA